MKTYIHSLLAIIAALLFLTSTHAQQVKERDNMRNARYGEIIVITGGPFNFTGHVYNTIGLNNCPEAAWKSLDPQKIKSQFHARAVILNGPRYFLMDTTSIANPGAVVSFDTLQARFLADVSISLASILRGSSQPYTENKVSRTTRYLFKKGNTLHELISPRGTRYVMQTYSQQVDPKLTEADLASLGKKLSLPAGWHYEIHPLDQDYVMQTSGVAYVLQDNLKNSYQRE
ncbi:MAG: hypothetical protein K2W97_08405 [Chthoniobacterales bacterium]|nr:hypothetical protein [Chthoniobacterales bacterium]